MNYFVFTIFVAIFFCTATAMVPEKTSSMLPINASPESYLDVIEAFLYTRNQKVFDLLIQGIGNQENPTPLTFEHFGRFAYCSEENQVLFSTTELANAAPKKLDTTTRLRQRLANIYEKIEQLLPTIADNRARFTYLLWLGTLYAKHYAKDPVKQVKISILLGGIVLQDQFPDLAETALARLRVFATSQPKGQRFLQDLLQHPSPHKDSKDAMPLSEAKRAMIFKNIGILYLNRKKREKARWSFNQAIAHSIPEEKEKLTAFLQRINLT